MAEPGVDVRPWEEGDLPLLERLIARPSAPALAGVHPGCYNCLDPWGRPAGFLSLWGVSEAILKSYDLVYIVRPDLETDAVTAVTQRMTQRITDLGGTVEAVDVWGKKRMSYAVKRYREGVFVHTRFALDPQRVEEVRRAAALTEDVLRATITNAVGKLPEPKPEAKPQEPAPAETPAAQPTEV